MVALLISCSSHCTSLWFSRPLAARSWSNAWRFTIKASASAGAWARTTSVRCGGGGGGGGGRGGRGGGGGGRGGGGGGRGGRRGCGSRRCKVCVRNMTR